MMVLKTLEMDEEFLRQRSLDVDFERDDYMKYVEELKEYCVNHVVYAMAPVQIGIPKRMIYIRNSSQDMANNLQENYDEGIVYINPVIISRRGHTKFLEGCESCSCIVNNELKFYAGIVDRPYSIEVKCYDINGNEQTKVLEGFAATVFSHEYDHLNGVLHMDVADEVFQMSLEQMRKYRGEHPYEIISKE